MAGTLIETTKGAQAIETIRVGDYVLSKSDETGEVALAKVTETFRREGKATVLFSVCSGSDRLDVEVTTEHPIYIRDQGWVAASDLRIGDAVDNVRNIEGRVCGLRTMLQARTVYNLTTEPWHTFFLAVGWWVHNTVSTGNIPAPGRNPTQTPSVAPSSIDDVIAEASASPNGGNYTSAYRVTEDQALEAGRRWVGAGYREIHLPQGVWRSADGSRQFRIDPGSINGSHGSIGRHIHLESIDPVSVVTTANSHIELR
ncbi:MAG: polymorphic toxin-type HINT domain-containing protein [Deltaproteobacteria bacterium]|nr:polymorphic toxin-type HINT domain-containing protein [Deltaproteobacteria bacterium]